MPGPVATPETRGSEPAVSRAHDRPARDLGPCSLPDCAAGLISEPKLSMASNLIKNVTEADFEAEVLKSTAPVLVDFWAEWCGPCKMIGPVLDEVATELDGQLRIVKVDVDSQSALATQYGITAIPTLLVFKGGQIVDQMRGAKNKRAIKETVEPYL